MKTITYFLIGAALLPIFPTQAQTTGKGITVGEKTAPHATAVLDIRSTTKGVLLPRMTQTQREAIPVTSGSHGLLVYQTDNASGLYIYLTDNTGRGVWTGLIVSDDLQGIERVLAENNNANKLSLENLKQLLADTIGIGTTSPAQPLHVEGNGHISNRLGIGTTSPAQPLHVEGNGHISNRLGIGTPSPAQPLHVEGNGHISNRLGIGDDSPDYTVEVNSTEGQTRLRLINGSDEHTFFLRGSDNNFGFYDDRRNQTWLRYVSEADVADRTLSIMESGGNVGIGTGSPGERLHVNGLIRSNGTDYNRTASNTGERANTRNISAVYLEGTTPRGGAGAVNLVTGGVRTLLSVSGVIRRNGGNQWHTIEAVSEQSGAHRSAIYQEDANIRIWSGALPGDYQNQPYRVLIKYIPT